MYVDIAIIQNTDESAFISRERSFQTYKIEEKESQTPLFENREGHLSPIFIQTLQGLPISLFLPNVAVRIASIHKKTRFISIPKKEC